MKLTDVQEEYLKTIYMLENTEKIARVTDIAKKLNKTKSTVNYSIKNLKEEGLINYETYGEIALTEEGKRKAQKILEAYDIVYVFLKEVLNLDDEKAKNEAEKIKSVATDETINKLARYVHEVLGLSNLNCNYDINQEKCRNCIKRTNSKKGN